MLLPLDDELSHFGALVVVVVLVLAGLAAVVDVDDAFFVVGVEHFDDVDFFDPADAPPPEPDPAAFTVVELGFESVKVERRLMAMTMTAAVQAPLDVDIPPLGAVMVRSFSESVRS